MVVAISSLSGCSTSANSGPPNERAHSVRSAVSLTVTVDQGRIDDGSDSVIDVNGDVPCMFHVRCTNRSQADLYFTKSYIGYWDLDSVAGCKTAACDTRSHKMSDAKSIQISA